MKALIALLLLSGCAAEQIADLRPALIECLHEGKLLAAVKVDGGGKVTEAACLPVRLGRPS